MTQEEKELVIKDLCARLPYSVQIHISYEDGFKYDKTLTYEDVKNYSQLPACSTTIVKLYLRPMSSMTEKEKDEFLHFFPFCRGDMYFDVKNTCVEVFECPNKITLYPFWDNVRLIDWLNKKMFDYRDLIPNGLALEAPEGMYNNLNLKYLTQEEPDIEFIKLVIGDNVKQLNKLHYERMKEKKVKCEVLTAKKRIGRCLQHEPWITMEVWKCMSHSQYYNKFFVVELVWEIGYMGKHLICTLDKKDNFILDGDYGSGRAIDKDKIAAIMSFNPYNEKTLCL